MLSKIFLGFSLIGAEWVLYLLVILSVISIALIIERIRFYRRTRAGLAEFRRRVRDQVSTGKPEEATRMVLARSQTFTRGTDLETPMAKAILDQVSSRDRAHSVEVLNQVAIDAILRTKGEWDKNLSLLASIGTNAPFIGLFGTVLGIIKAFHDLSNSSIGGVNTVSSGISEALVATAVGILVAIPATWAFNSFQKTVKSAIAEAEALKSFLIGHLSAKS